MDAELGEETGVRGGGREGGAGLGPNDIADYQPSFCAALG
jgi:hypothetical protein